MLGSKVLLLHVLVAIVLSAPQWRPVVLMHGLLASNEAMSHAQAWIEQDFPGIYVKNVEVGNGREDSLFLDIDQQILLFTKAVQSDPKLKKGFNLIGHSQGGLISRAYIQRFNDPPVYNFLSWAGPHAGQYGVPELNYLCPDYDCPWLDEIFSLIIENAYGSWIQNHISFAAYWKDPFDFGDYLQYSHFIADINNERDVKNKTYRDNIISLNTMVLIYSTIENIVIPATSPWFQFYDVGHDDASSVKALKDTDQYKQDWLGLQTLDVKNKLKLYSIDCDHADIPRDVCKKWYIKYSQQYLNNTIN